MTKNNTIFPSFQIWHIFQLFAVRRCTASTSTRRGACPCARGRRWAPSTSAPPSSSSLRRQGAATGTPPPRHVKCEWVKGCETNRNQREKNRFIPYLYIRFSKIETDIHGRSRIDSCAYFPKIANLDRESVGRRMVCASNIQSKTEKE